MTPLAEVMLWAFVVFWFVAMGGFVYANRYFLPMWANGFRKNPEHAGYPRKIFIGTSVFLGAIAACFAAGGVAELAGGW